MACGYHLMLENYKNPSQTTLGFAPFFRYYKKIDHLAFYSEFSLGLGTQPPLTTNMMKKQQVGISKHNLALVFNSGLMKNGL